MGLAQIPLGQLLFANPLHLRRMNLAGMSRPIDDGHLWILNVFFIDLFRLAGLRARRTSAAVHFLDILKHLRDSQANIGGPSGRLTMGSGLEKTISFKRSWRSARRRDPATAGQSPF